MLDAVAIGAELIVTTTLEVAIHPLAVTVTVYVPLIADVELGLVGFCNEEVYPEGPVHA